MNILGTPIIIPMRGGGGRFDPTQFHKIIIALSMVLFVIMIMCLIVGFFKKKKFAELFGWKYVWNEILYMPSVFLPFSILCFIAIGYAVYGIYLLL